MRQGTKNSFINWEDSHGHYPLTVQFPTPTQGRHKYHSLGDGYKHDQDACAALHINLLRRAVSYSDKGVDSDGVLVIGSNGSPRTVITPTSRSPRALRLVESGFYGVPMQRYTGYDTHVMVIINNQGKLPYRVYYTFRGRHTPVRTKPGQRSRVSPRELLTGQESGNNYPGMTLVWP